MSERTHFEVSELRKRYWQECGKPPEGEGPHPDRGGPAYIPWLEALAAQLEAELLQYKADLRATDGQVVELEAMLKQAAENDFHSEVVQTEMLQLELEENPWMGAEQYKEDWIETWLCALREGEG